MSYSNSFEPLKWLGEQGNYLTSKPLKNLPANYHSLSICDQLMELLMLSPQTPSEIEVVKLEIQRRFESKKVGAILRLLLEIYNKQEQLTPGSSVNLSKGFSIGIRVMAEKLSRMTDQDVVKKCAAHWDVYSLIVNTSMSPIPGSFNLKGNVDSVLQKRIDLLLYKYSFFLPVSLNDIQSRLGGSIDANVRFFLQGLPFSVPMSADATQPLPAYNSPPTGNVSSSHMPIPRPVFNLSDTPNTFTYNSQSGTPSHLDSASCGSPPLSTEYSSVAFNFPASETQVAMSYPTWGAWIAGGLYDYTFGVMWSVYNRTFGYILNPLAISALVLIDYYRQVVEKKLLPGIESKLGVVLSFFAAGTGLVGSFKAVVGTPFLNNSLGIYGALGVSTTSVAVQGFLNYLNSTTQHVSDTVSQVAHSAQTSAKYLLSPWKLNVLLVFCTFAGACSGVLARTAPGTLGNAIAAKNDYTFSEAGEWGLFGAGLFLGLINGSISALSGYQSNKVFFQEELPALINDYQRGKHKVFVPAIMFMLTCLSVLMTYSQPTAEFILGSEECEEKTLNYFLVMIGLGVVNLTVIPLFFNPAYKFIKSVVQHEGHVSKSNIFARICTALTLSLVFILANYGNAKSSALAATGSSIGSTIMGAAGGISAMLPAFQSAQGLYTRASAWFQPTQREGEEEPLLNAHSRDYGTTASTAV